MTIALIVLAIALAGAMAAVVWLVHRGDKRVDQTLEAKEQLNSARQEIVNKTLETERARFEEAKAVQALVGERARANALEDFISHDADEVSPSADLAPDDINGRVFRLSQKWGTANVSSIPDTGSKVHPVTSGEVHTEGSPKVPDAPTVSRSDG